MSDSGMPPPPPTHDPYGVPPGTPPGPPAPPYPYAGPGTVEPAPKRSKAPLVVGLLVLLLALGGGTFAAVTLLSDDDEKSSAITYPDAWDERVLPYVEIAEKERDLDFKHPVEVRFLEPDAFVEERKVNEDDITDEDRKEIEQTTGLFRAIGLLSGDVDLLKALQDFSDSSVLAYYSFEDKRITIRGTEITPAIKSTLVHELVHVLQDQHFEIGKRTEELGQQSEDDEDTTTESTVLEALIEGDASRIEEQYKESLSSKDRKALEESEEEQNDEPSEAAKKIPKIISTIQQAPYVLGEAVVAAVVADGDNDDVDDLFTDTPAHEAALLDAFELLDGDTDAEEVSAPALADGEEKFDSGEFGALTLYFVLAERLPLKQAIAAADGWGGDQYVAFNRDDAACFRIAYVGDTDDDTALMEDALQDWIAAADGSTSTVERDGDQLVFESCDPGTDGFQGKDASEDALVLTTIRTYIGISVLKAGAPAEFSGCVAEGVVQAFSLEQLKSDEGATDPGIQQQIQQIGAGCR